VVICFSLQQRLLKPRVGSQHGMDLELPLGRRQSHAGCVFQGKLEGRVGIEGLQSLRNLGAGLAHGEAAAAGEHAAHEQGQNEEAIGPTRVRRRRMAFPVCSVHFVVVQIVVTWRVVRGRARSVAALAQVQINRVGAGHGGAAWRGG